MENYLVDHSDGTKIINEILAHKRDSVACNVLALWEDIVITLSQMQNNITDLQARVALLEKR